MAEHVVILKPEWVVAWLDAMDASDPEAAHIDAEELLLGMAPLEVREAYARLQNRCKWWTHA